MPQNLDPDEMRKRLQNVKPRPAVLDPHSLVETRKIAARTLVDPGVDGARIFGLDQEPPVEPVPPQLASMTDRSMVPENAGSAGARSGETARVTFLIDETLHRRLRMHCLSKKTTVKAFVTKLIESIAAEFPEV